MRKFITATEGLTSIEYGLILVLVAAIMAAGVHRVHDSTRYIAGVLNSQLDRGDGESSRATPEKP